MKKLPGLAGAYSSQHCNAGAYHPASLLPLRARVSFQLKERMSARRACRLASNRLAAWACQP